MLKIWGPKNVQSKSALSPGEHVGAPVAQGNASRSNNPPPPLEKKLRVAGAVKPGSVGEENVTSIDCAGKFATPPDGSAQDGVDDGEHGEGTVNVNVNFASGAETRLVEESDA